MSLLNTPCIVVKREPAVGGLNPWDEPTDGYGNATQVDTQVQTVCSLQQSSRDEPGAAGELSITDWDLFLPAGTSLDTGDAVLVGGVKYEVVGAPWNATEGSAAVNHMAASVRRTASAEDDAP